MNKIRARVTSLKAWKLAKEPSSLAPLGVRSNKDLDPIPPELRLWTALDFANYWVSDLVNITSWSIGTAPLLVGLSTVDAIIIVMLSGICNAVPTVLNGYIGSDHHVAFPVGIRSSFGYYFGYFAVVSRAVLSAVWFGVNCYYGLFGMTEAIAAIWPSYRDIPNQLPESAGITTLQMVSFFLFTTMHIPFMLIPVHRLKRLFFWKSIVIIPVSIAMTIWICVKAGDVKGIFNQPATVTGSTHKWLWLATLCSTTNSWLTATVNMADFFRFSKSTGGQWAQLPAIQIIKTVYAVLGLAVVGAGRVLYDEDLSTPVAKLPYWNSTGGGRFLSFCCAMLWILAQISCDLSANAVPFGHDIMAIIPGWINVHRGAIICLLLGAWAMVPWLIVNSASKFLTFMSAYGVFLSPICSIMIADYFIVRRRRLNVVDLYHPHGCYRYRAGINWRAFVTEFTFVGITLPGVANSIITPTIPIPGGLLRIYQLNWFVNTFGPFFVYWALCAVWPLVKSIDSVAIESSSSSNVEIVHQAAGEHKV